MKITHRASDPVTLQLLKLSVRKKNAIVAACDRDLRYTQLHNPHPAFDAEASLGMRDVDLAPAEDVAELVALKEEVLETGREVQRRTRIRVVGEPRIYDVTAEPIHDERGRVIGVATAALDVTPTVATQKLLRRVAEHLEDRVGALTARWHEELNHRLEIRPQSIFPTDDVLDGVPRVVTWLARTVADGEALDAENTDSLREIAGHWRRGGYTIEESLLHLEILHDLLADAMAAAAREAHGSTPPSAGVEAARRLSRALHVVKVVFVAAYRDAEADRFTDFGATLAHEIRGHISTAMMGVDTLGVLEDPAREAEALSRVRHALRRANDVVTAVHSLSRAAGGDPNRWSDRPLDEVVREVVAERESGTPVRVETDDAIPAVGVPAEPVRLILHNLVTNAIKYRDPAASPPWVRVHAELDPGDGHLTIHVGDNGLGIPEEEQERIFLRFRRGREANGDGFGLGLAIVRETAAKFGGQVLLESEAGRGSTFSLTIPESQLRTDRAGDG